MAKQHTRNRIIFFFGVLLLLGLTLWGLNDFVPATVALEQEARCGVSEHIHTDTCYIDEVLVCSKKMHNHSANCYLVLLDENNVNQLIELVDRSESKNLETVINTALEQAADNLSSVTVGSLSYKDPTVTADTLLQSSDSITQANDFFFVSGTALTFNANLSAANPFAATPDDTESIGAGTLEGITTAAPSTSNNAVNVYVWFVDEEGDAGWVFVASTTYSVSSRTARITKTSLTTLLSNNIGYRTTPSNLYYATSATASSFTKTGTSGSSYITMGSTGSNSANGARYLYVGATSTSTTTAPSLKFCRITYDYGSSGLGTNSTSYTQTGQSITLPTLSAEYEWKDQDGNTYSGGTALSSLSKSYTLTATLRAHTVSFQSSGGSAVATQYVPRDNPDATRVVTKPADPTRTGYSFAGWYSDTALTQAYDFSTPVNGSLTLYAKWTPIPYTATFLNEDGSLLTTETHGYGQSFTLPMLEGDRIWVTGTSSYPGGASYTLTGDVTFRAASAVLPTFVYANGSTTVGNPVNPGTQITLPALSASGNVWVDEAGNVYSAGHVFTLTHSTTFTERTTLTIQYNVNFSDSGLSSSSPPTLVETGGTTATVTVVEGMQTVIYSVTPRTYISSPTGNDATHFVGWVPASNTAVTLLPGTNISWELLQSYARNGVVTLNGDWNRDSTNSTTTVRFYVRFDSIPPDTSGSVGSHGTDYYTGQVYLSYAGTPPNTSFNIADRTPDNSYTADRTIRSLVGDKGDGSLWISGVPDDAWLLEQLKTYTKEQQTATEVSNNKYLRIYVGQDSRGNAIYEDVLASELDTDHYAIRWYVFKKEGDGWHVDGRLVKKTGQITVDKIFGGVEAAVQQVRDGFYILAENGTYDAQTDTFQPYTYAKQPDLYNSHVLVLTDITEAQKAQLRSQYPNAIIQVYNTEKDLLGNTVDEWLIEDVRLDEHWRFTEYTPNYDENMYSWYAEYSISDSDGERSAIAEFGSVARVIGKTYALDEDHDQGLHVEFTNYYYSKNSILIRKIDGDTGKPLGGAEFQLWQPSSEGGSYVQLKFTDNGNGVYIMDAENGTIGSIVTNAEGFSVISVQNFSFDAGDLIIKEVAPPVGYSIVNDITLGYLDDSKTSTGIKSIAGTDSTDFDYHAEYYNESGGVLVVKDHAATYTSVTVNKIWQGSVSANSVTVVLQATVGGVTYNAGVLFPYLTGHQAVLTASGNWQHTWTDLPAYANGELVEWSVKEILIGNDTTMTGSDTFANWIVSYSTPVSTDNDGDGVPDLWTLNVTNTVKRPMLILTKTDMNGAALVGAQFTLTEVTWNAATSEWKDLASSYVTYSVSGNTHIFDNLAAGVYYRLTETAPPDGYFTTLAPVILTVDGAGVVKLVTVSEGVPVASDLALDMIRYTNPFNILVKNVPAIQLPSTGGAGSDRYVRAGLLLMAAVCGLYAYTILRRREENTS